MDEAADHVRRAMLEETRARYVFQGDLIEHMTRSGMNSQEAETLLKHMEETIHLLEEMGGVEKRFLSGPATSLTHADPMS